MTMRLARMAMVVLVSAGASTGGEPFSWQKDYARVSPTGDIEWTPEPFRFEKGDSVRYIDYEGGRDSNDGLTPNTPWRHHPWDARA